MAAPLTWLVPATLSRCRKMKLSLQKGSDISPTKTTLNEKFIEQPELIEKMGKTARLMADQDYNARNVAQGLIRAMRLYP